MNSTTFSASLLQVLGYSAPPRVDIEWWWEKMHPADRRQVLAGLEKALRAEKTRWSARYRLRQASGRYVAVVDHLVIIFDQRGVRRVIGCACRSESKKGTHHGATERANAVIHALPQLAWSADPGGWVDFANRRFQEYTLQRRDEVEGWGWLEAFDPTRLTRLLSMWRRSLQTGEPLQCEVRIRRGSDRAWRWHLCRIVPLQNPRGGVVRWVGTATDIHAIKQKHARILTWERRSRRSAEALGRAKDEFLAVVSHELRTPLNAILGWAQLIRSGQLDDDRKMAAIQKIERNAFQQTKLIEDLLDVARIISNKIHLDREPVNPGACTRAAADALQQAAEGKRMRLEVVNQAPEARVLGSARRLEQVFINLLSNAIKFSREGMAVTIQVRQIDAWVEVSVTDYGKGIPRELLSAVFERFRQADVSSSRDHGGLGLGLAISRHLVEMHGGRISAESAGLGHGATFTVTLPAVIESPPSVVPQHRRGKHQAPSLAGIHALVVDDNADAREVAYHVLAACGAQVTLACSAGEGLVLAAEQTPDVVISDVAMPGMDGCDLVRRIRTLSDERAASVPIIALSAHAGPQDKRRAREAGFDEYVVKPVETVSFATSVARLIERTASRRSPPVGSAATD